MKKAWHLFGAVLLTLALTILFQPSCKVLAYGLFDFTLTPQDSFYYEGDDYEYDLGFFASRYFESNEIEDKYLKNVVLDTMSYKTGITSSVSGEITLTDAYDSRLGYIYVLVEDAEGAFVDCALLDTTGFTAGTTQKFSIDLNFYDRGLHKLVFVSKGDFYTYILTTCEKLKVTVGEAATSTLAFDKTVISEDDSAKITLSYLVPSNNTEYELVVGKFYDDDIHDFNFYKAEIMTELSTELDEIDRDGAVHTLSYEGPFAPGYYKAELKDLRTGSVVTEARFIVAPAKYYPFRIDEENNEIPFAYKLSTQYLDLEQGKTMTITYQYGVKLDKYIEAIDAYYREGDTSKLYRLTDTKTITRVSYKPADGSKQYDLDSLKEQLNADELWSEGLVRTIKLSAEDVYDYINDRFDSLLSSKSGKNGQLAITMGGDVVRINVGASASLTSCKVDSKTKTRAYGESFNFYTEDAAGGKIVVEIYNKKNKLVKKLTATSEVPGINMEETAEAALSWDLTNKNGKYVAAGKYTAKVYLITYALDLNGGKTKTEIKSDPVEIKLTLKKFNGTASMSPSLTGEGGKSSAPLESPVMRINLGLNVGCKVKLEVKNSSGSVLKTYNYVWGSGDFDGMAVDLSSLDSKLKVGSKYTVSATGTTLEGKTCKGSASFEIVKASKPSITNTSVSVNNGVGSFSFGISTGGKVKVTVKNSSGNVISTALDQSCSAGSVKGSFSAGGLAAGTYTVSISATNSGGTTTATKSFSIPKKVEKVDKPVLSELKTTWITYNKEDALKIEVDYTGKNTVIYYDIMYVDSEECVYSGHCSTSGSSGHVTMTWDGNKSNGFRAHVGEYFVRVYGVNSGGTTTYLKKTFTINVG